MYTIFQCSAANNTYHRHSEQQQVGDDIATIVNSEDHNACNIVADNISTELKTNAIVPMNFRSETNDSSNNNINANANIEIDDETMTAPFNPSDMAQLPSPPLPSSNVNVAFSRTASLCITSSTSDGNDNSTLKQWRRRLRTPVWARSLTLQF